MHPFRERNVVTESLSSTRRFAIRFPDRNTNHGKSKEHHANHEGDFRWKNLSTFTADLLVVRMPASPKRQTYSTPPPRDGARRRLTSAQMLSVTTAPSLHSGSCRAGDIVANDSRPYTIFEAVPNAVWRVLVVMVVMARAAIMVTIAFSADKRAHTS